MIIKYPKPLKLGDFIGITAPSSGANLEKVDKAINNLKNLGFQIIETKNARNNYKCVSADSYTRFKEFVEMWENSDVRLILPSRRRRVFN